METPNGKKGEKTFAQAYANVFERLALKIVKSVFSEKIIASKTTKETRDSGIDAIIKSSDGNVTIEAKLRKYSYRLGLKDVATSIIFYLLRKNRKHYIVSNVVFANDSFKVIQDINQTNRQYCIECLCGEQLIAILENILPDLDKEEKVLAEHLIKHVCGTTKKVTIQPLDIPKLLKEQQSHVSYILKNLQKGIRCVILDGVCGIGKTYIANTIACRLKSENQKVISIDCQIHSTVQKFFYKFSDELIGITMSYLIQQFRIMENFFEYDDTLSNEYETYDALWQILSTDYRDDIRYLAEQYIQNLLSRYSPGKITVILDNFVNCDINLCKFICDLIASIDQKLSFLIVLDRNIALKSGKTLLNLESCPNKFGLFYRESIDASYNDAVDFIRSQYSGGIKAEDICKKFGTNLSVLKMVISELNDNKFLDITFMRPLEYSSICQNILINKINERNRAFACCCFSLWVGSECLDFDMLTIIAKAFQKSTNKLKSDLLSTNLFVQTDEGIVCANLLVNQILNEIFIKTKDTLKDLIQPFCELLHFQSMQPRAKIRFAYYKYAKDYKAFLKIARVELSKLQTLYDSQAELECRYFILTYVYNFEEDNIDRIEVTSDFLYSFIEQDYSFGKKSVEFFEIEKWEEYLRNIFSLSQILGFRTKEQNRFAESALKFALYEYFKYKRINDFNKAQTALENGGKYFAYCSNIKLISRVARFSAIVFKELGRREDFFQEMAKWKTKYPNNTYLQATNMANLAADKCMNDPVNSLNEVRTAIHLLGTEYPYLRLWLNIDALIYQIYAKQFDKLSGDIDSQITTARRLCSLTDFARLENIRGALCLRNKDINGALTYFGSAFKKLWYHEPNHFMLYLAANYLSMLDERHASEYEEIMDYLMNWLCENKENITLRLNDSSVNQEKSKLVLALKSIQNTIDTMNRIDQCKAFEFPYAIAINKIKVRDSLLINGRYIVLF